MVIGVVGAMQEEISPVMNNLEDTKTKVISGLKFVKGRYKHLSVVAVCSGIGKINAAVGTQILIDRYAITHAIFTGVAGGIAPGLDIGDVVLGADIVQYDMDVTALGYELGFIPRLGMRAFQGDAYLLNQALQAAKVNPACFGQIVKGRILTGDSFIADHQRGKELHEKLGGLCVDMEGAAVAQACHLAEIPSLVIRSLSDKADSDANLDYKACIRLAADRAAQLTCALLSSL